MKYVLMLKFHVIINVTIVCNLNMILQNIIYKKMNSPMFICGCSYWRATNETHLKEELWEERLQIQPKWGTIEDNSCSADYYIWHTSRNDDYTFRIRNKLWY